jgi:hypothetical protein
LQAEAVHAGAVATVCSCGASTALVVGVGPATGCTVENTRQNPQVPTPSAGEHDQRQCGHLRSAPHQPPPHPPLYRLEDAAGVDLVGEPVEPAAQVPVEVSRHGWRAPGRRAQDRQQRLAAAMQQALGLSGLVSSARAMSWMLMSAK